MITEEQLDICKRCKNQSWEFTKGTICGLTNEYPNFSGSCSLFILDEERARKYQEEKERRSLNELEDNTFGLNTIGIKSQSVAGLIVAAVGTLLTITTIIYLGIISLWTLGIIATGLIFVGRGIRTKPAVIPGIITMGIGSIFTIATIYYLGVISIWSVLIILIGIVFMIIGLVKKSKSTNETSIDSDL